MSTQEELWQACNEAGEPMVDRGIAKREAAAGALHMSAHIWIWRKTGSVIEVILQRRSESLVTWPGYMDMSAAGHVDYGETPLQAALRETREEIGITLNSSDLKLLFVHRACDEDNGIIENEFVWVFGCELQGDHTLKAEDGEVTKLAWVRLAELQELIAGHSQVRFVPHGEAYFGELFKEIGQSHP